MNTDPNLHARLESIDPGLLGEALDAQGHALIPGLLSVSQCQALAALYGSPALGNTVPAAGFRNRVVMQHHGFGRGEYQYFAYPLPRPIALLRDSLYARLAPIANRWHAAMRMPSRFPARHADFLARCHAAGQQRPTPLLLRYREYDDNCLHQDLYGEQVFPLQVVLLLSAPGEDFEGGEFVMTEQRPRMQSRPMVVPLRQGDAAVIAVHHRPVQGSRGSYRVNMRHGVSRVHAGQRFAAGIIFHDAA